MDFIAPVIDGLLSFGATTQNNRNQRQLAQYQNAFNLEMWNKNNEYNSPSETIKRLVSAGVNPRSYSQLGQFANSADAPQAATYEKRSGLEAFSSLFQTMLSMQQIAAQTKKAEADALKAKAEADKAEADTDYRIEDLDFLRYKKDGYISQSREDRIRHEVWSRERGFTSWKDFDDILSPQGFSDYIDQVKTTRRYQMLSEKEKYNLRRFENQLKRLELDSLEYIPKQYRYIIDKLFKLF